MNKNDLWDNKLKQLFSDSNNMIIRTRTRHADGDHMAWTSMKFYLATKEGNELYFHDRLEAVIPDGYKYDDNSNLQILDNEDKVVKEIPREKIFAFKEEHFADKTNEYFDFFVNLPLSKPISLEQFKRVNGLPTVSVEVRIKDEAIELLQEKQVEAIRYDADKVFDGILETNMQNVVAEPEDFEEERE